MSSNKGITAKEARETTNQSEYSLDQLMKEVNFKIEAISGNGGSSITTMFSKEGLSQEKMEFAVDDLGKRGFNAELTSDKKFYTLKVSW